MTELVIKATYGEPTLAPEWVPGMLQRLFMMRQQGAIREAWPVPDDVVEWWAETMAPFGVMAKVELMSLKFVVGERVVFRANLKINGKPQRFQFLADGKLIRGDVQLLDTPWPSELESQRQE